MIHKIDFKDLPKNTKTPVLSYCRKLIKQGIDPNDSLECYRGEQMDLRVSNIGKGATLTVKGDDEVLGTRPHFARYTPPSRGVARIA